jgi:hypothetical protein
VAEFENLTPLLSEPYTGNDAKPDTSVTNVVQFVPTPRSSQNFSKIKNKNLQWGIVNPTAGLSGLSLRRYFLLCTFTATLRTWSQTPPSATLGRPMPPWKFNPSRDLCIAASEVTGSYTSQSAVCEMRCLNFSPNWEEHKFLSAVLSVMSHSQWKVPKGC